MRVDQCGPPDFRWAFQRGGDQSFGASSNLANSNPGATGKLQRIGLAAKLGLA